MQTIEKLQTGIPIGDNIERFAKLVQSGIDAWQEAGKLLVTLKKFDPLCFGKIRSVFPEISSEMLLVFERIGRKQIYAPLLADNSLAGRRLIDMPYEVQEKYFKEPIEVAVSWKNGAIKTAKKRLCELSRPEVNIVFGDRSVRTLEQQAFRLKDKKPSPPEQKENCNTVDIGYFALTLDKAGTVKIVPCGKSGLAQPVRVLPTGDGWKSAIIVFYREKNHAQSPVHVGKAA